MPLTWRGGPIKRRGAFKALARLAVWGLAGLAWAMPDTETRAALEREACREGSETHRPDAEVATRHGLPPGYPLTLGSWAASRAVECGNRSEPHPPVQASAPAPSPSPGAAFPAHEAERSLPLPPLLPERAPLELTASPPVSIARDRPRSGDARLPIASAGDAALRLAQAEASSMQDAGAPLPLSREALFGLAPAEESAPRLKWGGFLDATLAYTYGKPSHWSRAVARAQLQAEGRLGGGVRWKAGARVDADPVYFASDFYLPQVKEDERLDAFWREIYLDFPLAGWELRVGAQNIVWGEVVGLFFADVVSARDLRDFLLPGFDVIRIPQWAARAEYFAGDAHLELVWIPVPAFDDIGKPGSDFYPVPLPSPTPPEAAALFLGPEHPARTLGNGNYGLRFNTLTAGWDWSLFYYRSFSAHPTFYRLAPAAPGLPARFQPRHDRIWQLGGTVSKDLGAFVLRAEAVYTHGQRFSVADPTIPDGVVEQESLDVIAGADFSLGKDTQLNVQAFQRTFLDGGGGNHTLKTDGFGASLRLTTQLGNRLEPQLLWIQSFKDAGGLIRPRLNWRLEKNTTLGVGLDIFTGPADGFFGRYGNRDRIYTELRHDF